MQKRIRDKSKMFSMNKENREQEHIIFTEFYKLPFQLKEHQNYITREVETTFISDGSVYVRRLIDAPNKDDAIAGTKLLKIVIEALNGGKLNLKLKNIKFRCNSLDDKYILINDDAFLNIISEESIRYHMNNTGHMIAKSPKSIRRSLMAYIIKKLNESIEN